MAADEILQRGEEGQAEGGTGGGRLQADRALGEVPRAGDAEPAGGVDAAGLAGADAPLSWRRCLRCPASAGAGASSAAGRSHVVWLVSLL